MASAGIKPERNGKCNEDNRKKTLNKTAKSSAKSLRCIDKTSSRRGGWKKRDMPEAVSQTITTDRLHVGLRRVCVCDV